MIIDVNEKAIVKAMRKRTTRLEREGDYWSEEERRQLTSMFEEGYGLTEISIYLQRTEPAVMQQAEKLDLYHRKDNPSRRRSIPKAPACLCSICELDARSCPFCEAYLAVKEAI